MLKVDDRWEIQRKVSSIDWHKSELRLPTISGKQGHLWAVEFRAVTSVRVENACTTKDFKDVVGSRMDRSFHEPGNFIKGIFSMHSG